MVMNQKNHSAISAFLGHFLCLSFPLGKEHFVSFLNHTSTALEKK